MNSADSLLISSQPGPLNSIGPDNWTYCKYRLNDKIVFISIGADPAPASDGAVLEFFYVTLLNSEFKEIFQKKFMELHEACHFINQTYGYWDFEDQSLPAGGCGSCQNNN